jgi:hypothetical protein
MTETPAAPPSPNDVLASQIADALVTAGLIKDAHKTELLSKLKVGGVKQEDWNLWVDMATAPPRETVEPDDE